nr:scytalone dehydratase [Colletotrichum truncatum]KAF6789541.1 scytalone dehydratase [Colletotrichum truncatum]
MTLSSSLDYTVADERAFRLLSFKWTLAWDKKDIDTWLSITGPTIVADYTDYPAVGILKQGSPEELFKSSFSRPNLGHPQLETQHFLGAVVFTRVNDNEVRGDWQVRARHVRRLSDGQSREWDSSAYCEFLYVKINEEWKLGGLRPHTVVATTGHPEEVIGDF